MFDNGALRDDRTALFRRVSRVSRAPASLTIRRCFAPSPASWLRPSARCVEIPATTPTRSAGVATARSGSSTRRAAASSPAGFVGDQRRTVRGRRTATGDQDEVRRPADAGGGRRRPDGQGLGATRNGRLVPVRRAGPRTCPGLRRRVRSRPVVPARDGRAGDARSRSRRRSASGRPASRRAGRGATTDQTHQRSCGCRVTISGSSTTSLRPAPPWTPARRCCARPEPRGSGR